jgi:hypothetical protein
MAARRPLESEPAERSARAPGPAPEVSSARPAERALTPATVGWLQAGAGNAAVGRLLARQAPANAPALAPAGATFQDLWGRFVPLRGTKSPDLRDLLPRMVALLEGEPAITHGSQLVHYLIDNGESELARDALERIEREYRKRQLRFQLEESEAVKRGAAGAKDLPGPGMFANPVDGFVDRGRAAARTGDHGLAHDLLTRAYLFLQMQLERAGPEIGDQPQATRILRHPSLARAYDQMRAILGVYPALERELTGAGNAAAAAEARRHGVKLRESIRSDFMLAGAEVQIADVSRVDTARGPALRIHGGTGEMDVTQLPGLPAPGEIGKSPYQSKPIEGVHESLEGQVDLVEDLLREPGVAKAFPRGDIDMSKLEHRLKVWKAIYDARQAGGGGLKALMETIGRYLKAFTVHTEYNVRDFGAKSYVQAEQAGELATDLAGRAERDCGVYALTVAYELHRTAKAAGLKIDFQLVTTLDHAMLVIREASGTFYIVSNNTVTPPLTGDVATELGKIAGGIRGRHVSLMPAMTFELGSSIGGAGKAEFSDAAAWATYKQAQFGLGQPGDDKDALYQQYYADQAELEKLTLHLEAALLAGRPKDMNEREWLTRRATALRPSYARLAFLWQQWGTLHAWKPGSAAAGMTLGAGPMTLSRYGKLILRRELLGDAPEQNDVNTLKVCDAIPPMHSELDAYRNAGRPPAF